MITMENGACKPERDYGAAIVRLAAIIEKHQAAAPPQPVDASTTQAYRRYVLRKMHIENVLTIRLIQQSLQRRLPRRAIDFLWERPSVLIYILIRIAHRAWRTAESVFRLVKSHQPLPPEAP